MSTGTGDDTIQVTITVDPMHPQNALVASTMKVVTGTVGSVTSAASPSAAVARFEPATLEDGQE